MLTHQHEWLVFVSVIFQPTEGKVSDDVRGVAFYFIGALRTFHWRVIVWSLPEQDFPCIKTGGVTLKVPLAEDGGLVTVFLQEFGKGLLTAIETVAIGHKAVEVTVLTGQDHCTAGAADGIGHKTVLEAHSLTGDAVYIWSLVAVGTICTDSLVTVVIRENEQDVGGLAIRCQAKCQGEE